MAKRVTVRYAKAHLPVLLERVMKGEEIVIASAGNPVHVTQCRIQI